ncbi:DNA-binding response regulator [Pseudomethylobacillus aquaticus]|uniref:DNA-binding response regulator n=1 Tax=Pseudomethylobacillus aquaticus TaxID=2676064 RepID=A0A3N0V070_9PROT|nr:response regulator transcription factor [Pseudomethylobacillus aquaticus]ROH86103.1 DNA-binding response regulator [Pseudomethylobacillus aquaticus]
MTEKIRVFIVDDHAILRTGLKQILNESDDVCVIGEADCGSKALHSLSQLPSDVVLLDISLPDRNGLEVLKLIKRDQPKTAVLMLSMHREDQYAIRSLKAGASGYLSKQSADSELLNAVRVVACGKKYVSPEVAQALANQIGEPEDKPRHETLSDREFETLRLIASGLTVGDIAEKLCLSVKTVSMYRARLLEKMQLRHNAELTHYAIRNNLID